MFVYTSINVCSVARKLTTGWIDGEMDVAVWRGCWEWNLVEKRGGEDTGKGNDNGEGVEIHCSESHDGNVILYGDGMLNYHFSVGVFLTRMSSHSSNPHPYAIKTTSTGILSRSNSSRSATAAHHFVPSSPTKPTSTHPRPINHRYSSSLNSNELPRPLPVPPSDNYTRDRRADTLPSTLSQPNLFGIDDDLPDDPRTWSPSDLSTYLSASLRLTSADLPPLVVHDITAFVRSQKLTGKKFLRLTDGDLDAYVSHIHS